MATRTDTNVIYAEGGFDPELPNGNAVYVAEQDYDDADDPVGAPRVLLDLTTR